MWRYFGLTQRAAPAEITDLMDAKFSLILEELTKLNRPPSSTKTTAPTPSIRDTTSSKGRVTRTVREEPLMSLEEAVEAARAEGMEFGRLVVTDAPDVWLEAVMARKPRMPSDLEARLLQDSKVPVDTLLHDEVRDALRKGFWAALEERRKS